MRRIVGRIRLLAGFVAIGFGVLFGKSGSWAMSRYFQLAMPMALPNDAAASAASTTVIVPTFNNATHIANAIESLKAQSYPLFRCLIIDDGSTDATVEVARRLIGDDVRFSIVTLKRNSGPAVARNAGLALTDTEFVMFLDSDDVMLPEALQSRVSKLRADRWAAGSFGHAKYVVDGVNWRKLKSTTLDRKQPRLSLTAFSGECPFLVHEVLMRTAAAVEIGGWDEGFAKGGCEDVEFFFRSLRSGHEYVDTQAQDCLYVQRTGSIVDSSIGHHIETVTRLVAANWAGDSPKPAMLGGRGLDGPLHDLTRQAAMQKRAFKFLGLWNSADVADSVMPAAMSESLAASRVISNQTAIEEMRLGVGRSVSRAGSQNPRMVDEVLAAATYQARHFMLPETPATPAPIQGEPGWAILVSDQAQAEVILNSLAGLPAESLPAVLTADAWILNAHALDRLATEEKWQTRSLVRYSLSGCAYALVAIPQARGEAAEIVARIAAKRGSRVVAWAPADAANLVGLAEVRPVVGVERVPVQSPTLETPR